MSVNNRPFFGDHLYLSGMPSRHIEETFADGCLSFPGHLSPNVRVEVILDDDEFSVNYMSQGCISSLFCSAFFVTSIIAKPFELIGKCMKNGALAVNPEAKAYNEMAANHLQWLQDRDASLDRIGLLKIELEAKLAQFSQDEKLYNLVLEKTELQPEGFLKAILEIDSTYIDLIIKPIVKNDSIFDYEISAPFQSISGLPTTKLELFQNLQSQKNRLQDLENGFITKLKSFQRVNASFENGIRTLLKPEINEHTSLI
jgi:hypothetical protein